MSMTAFLIYALIVWASLMSAAVSWARHCFRRQHVRDLRKEVNHHA